MIRKKEKETGPIIIDLTGPDGNAFTLIARVGSLGKLIGKTTEEIEAIRENMMSDDYEHLIQVFDDAFGDFVILER